MSELQHARIAELCSELHLAAVPDLYPVTAHRSRRFLEVYFCKDLIL